MRRTFTYVSAALTFCLMMLALSLPATSWTVKAADINEKCNECLERTAAHYNQCVAIFGELDSRCGEQFNRDIIICYRNFCEQ